MSAMPFVHNTVVHMLAQAGELSHDTPALSCEDRHLTYGEYVRCVAGFAMELKALGGMGDRVALRVRLFAAVLKPPGPQVSGDTTANDTENSRVRL